MEIGLQLGWIVKMGMYMETVGFAASQTDYITFAKEMGLLTELKP